MLRSVFSRTKKTTRWLLSLGSLLFWGAAAQVSMDFNLFNSLLYREYGEARVKVGLEWQQTLDQAKSLPEYQQVALVNQFFARNLRYRTDHELWGQEDYWATPLETLGRGLGDCEDYAIAKYISLRTLGITDDKLRLIYVKAKRPDGSSLAHMVLGYYPLNGREPIILDSLVTALLPASKRIDLSPVFSFNSQGLWSTTSTQSIASPTARLSRWRNVLQQTRLQGVSW